MVWTFVPFEQSLWLAEGSPAHQQQRFVPLDENPVPQEQIFGPSVKDLVLLVEKLVLSVEELGPFEKTLLDLEKNPLVEVDHPFQVYLRCFVPIAEELHALDWHSYHLHRGRCVLSVVGADSCSRNNPFWKVGKSKLE